MKAACDLDRMPLELLEREITELAAHIHAATCRFLLLVGELDRREGWAEWGCKSCAHWLSWRCAIGLGAAREQVRVARCMDELPVIRGAFGRGQLSFSQVRAMTRVAAPEIEAELVEIAEHATAAQLETLLRRYRGVLEVELGDADATFRRRYVTTRYDDDGSVLLEARLPAEEGGLVLAALEAARDALRTRVDVSAETSEARPAASNADALVLMADTLLGSGPCGRPGGERHQLVVHVACDASVVRILERDGRPLSVGRKSRSVPSARRRALQSRD